MHQLHLCAPLCRLDPCPTFGTSCDTVCPFTFVCIHTQKPLLLPNISLQRMIRCITLIVVQNMPSMCCQLCQVDDAVQTRVSEVSDASQAPQQQSGAATPLSEEVGDPTDPNSSQSAGHGMEKNYTDTIESLLSELWKERLVCNAAQCCFATPCAASFGRYSYASLAANHSIARCSRVIYS